ncbi:MAG: radical SAM protein [Bacteroidales bacterium]|nr:radical SAM protein [Bacteroidales bacterium]
MLFPDGKRYLSAESLLRQRCGERLQRLVVDAGFTCPNRDGSLGTDGCSFCDNAAFHPAYSSPAKPIRQQLDEGILFHRQRGRSSKLYLAYFQSFSNTYAPLERLREAYLEALGHPACAGIVIGTRPDCVDAEKLDFLAGLQDGSLLPDWRRELPSAPLDEPAGRPVLEAPLVMVEYGIESCRDETLRRVGRGHGFACSASAVRQTADRGIPVGGHFILGLPGETRQMLLDQCDAINALPLDFVKFHQLQLLRGTRIVQEFAATPEAFLNPNLDTYLDLLADLVERLRPDLGIGRLAASVPPRFLADISATPADDGRMPAGGNGVRGRWGGIRPSDLPALLDQRLSERNTWQGRLSTMHGQHSA